MNRERRELAYGLIESFDTEEQDDLEGSYQVEGIIPLMAQLGRKVGKN